MDTPSCPPNDQTQTSLTIFQLCVINMIVGLTMEVSLTGLLTTYCRLVQQGVKNVWKTALIMSIFNVSSLFYMILFFMASFLTETNCIIQNYFVNLASHLMYLSFDFFLLYKTWVIAAHDQHILWGAIVLYLHRFSWSVADVILTHGQWDSLSQQCFSAQYPITGVGYNAADIIIDAYCTVVSVFFTVNLISTSFADVAKVIIGDNVLRSLIILVVTSYNIYISIAASDFFTLIIAFCLQNYTYTRCLNFENIWITARKEAAIRSIAAAASGKHSMRPSTNHETVPHQPDAGKAFLNGAHITFDRIHYSEKGKDTQS